jgi:hypothetical protein
MSFPTLGSDVDRQSSQLRGKRQQGNQRRRARRARVSLPLIQVAGGSTAVEQPEHKETRCSLIRHELEQWRANSAA